MIDSKSIDHLRTTIADLMRWFEGGDLRAAVIGGVAASLHGRPRLTEDVDAVVIGDDASALFESGKSYGFTPRVDDAALARRPEDIADIVGIIDVQADLDVERIRHWVREFSSILEMPEIFDDLERLLKRRRL